MIDFLKDCVLARATILVSGGTGTGKTTIINLLSSFIPNHERVITIEDAFELQLNNAHVVSLQTKEASSADDTVAISLSDLLRNTLRMRPDRIIVGEIREGEGALTMLAASNTGHDGTMTTIHANSPSMAINERLPDLIRNIRNTPDDVAKRTVASAFDLIIQISRSATGFRYISDISAISKTEITNNLINLDKIFTSNIKSNKIEFKQVNKINRESKLGIKLSVLNKKSRWLDE
jgi:pilus assembly protein CpaF